MGMARKPLAPAPVPRKQGGFGGGDGWREDHQGDEQTLTFNNQDTGEAAADDLFTRRMLE
jgi:hypothetical protein